MHALHLPIEVNGHPRHMCPTGHELAFILIGWITNVWTIGFLHDMNATQPWSSQVKFKPTTLVNSSTVFTGRLMSRKGFFVKLHKWQRNSTFILTRHKNHPPRHQDPMDWAAFSCVTCSETLYVKSCITVCAGPKMQQPDWPCEKLMGPAIF